MSTPHNRKAGVGLYLSRGRNLGKSRVLCSRRLTSSKPPRSKGPTLSSLMRTSAVTFPRQLVPTMGPARAGFEILEEAQQGMDEFTFDWIARNQHKKFCIYNTIWTP